MSQSPSNSDLPNNGGVPDSAQELLSSAVASGSIPASAANVSPVAAPTPRPVSAVRSPTLSAASTKSGKVSARPLSAISRKTPVASIPSISGLFATPRSPSPVASTADPSPEGMESPARSSSVRATPARVSPARATPVRVTPPRATPARPVSARVSPARVATPAAATPEVAPEATPAASARASPVSARVSPVRASPARVSPVRASPVRSATPAASPAAITPAASPAASASSETFSVDPDAILASPPPSPRIASPAAITPAASIHVKAKSPGIPATVAAAAAPSTEAQLEAHNYTVVGRVIINDGEAGMRGEYVKAYDPSGLTVYVLLDTKGRLNVKASDLTTVSIADGSKIPVSDKSSVIHCAGDDVCGMAVTCGDELCTIVRNSEGEMRETSFVLTEAPTLKTITPSGMPVANVIVRMSEILQDPKGTIERTSRATIRINDMAHAATENALKRMVEKVDEVKKQLSTFCRHRATAINSLNDETTKLRSYASKYYAAFQKGTLEDEKDKYKQVVANIYARNSAFVSIISMTNQCVQMQQQLEQMMTDISGFDQAVMEKQEKTTGRSLTMEEIKASLLA